jgi:NADH-quinone oxidoreductase subunit G
MPDSGRELYKRVRAVGRLTETKIDGGSAPPAAAMAKAVQLLKAGGVAFVGSGHCSVEEQFLTKKLADALQAPAWLVSRVGQGDGILLSADRNPNVRGALVTGLIKELPSSQLTALAKKIDAGEIKTVLSLGEDLAAAGLTAAQLKKISIIYLGTRANATSAAAAVLLPTLTVFEKCGTFINQRFRLQKFSKAVPGVEGATDDLVVLAKLLAAAGGGTLTGDVDALWTTLSAEIPQFSAITFASLPATGLLLDRTPWASLPFAEGETLHYKPAQPAATTT